MTEINQNNFTNVEMVDRFDKRKCETPSTSCGSNRSNECYQDSLHWAPKSTENVFGGPGGILPTPKVMIRPIVQSPRGGQKNVFSQNMGWWSGNDPHCTQNKCSLSMLDAEVEKLPTYMLQGLSEVKLTHGSNGEFAVIPPPSFLSAESDDFVLIPRNELMCRVRLVRHNLRRYALQIKWLFEKSLQKMRMNEKIIYLSSELENHKQIILAQNQQILMLQRLVADKESEDVVEKPPFNRQRSAPVGQGSLTRGVSWDSNILDVRTCDTADKKQGVAMIAQKTENQKMSSEKSRNLRLPKCLGGPKPVHEVISDHSRCGNNQLHLSRGDQVEIIQTHESGWTYGRLVKTKAGKGCQKMFGWFPHAIVGPICEEEQIVDIPIYASPREVDVMKQRGHERVSSVTFMPPVDVPPITDDLSTILDSSDTANDDSPLSSE
eukprot:GHVL01024111.1.p1 GENE.GHVL01024111.1~~GHVL01024111.1.p1  ORF type:complete len:435 (+),score=62.00 GHVL01024111.1:158-1462(+)